MALTQEKMGNRRSFLRAICSVVLGATLSVVLPSDVAEGVDKSLSESKPWPKDEEGILARVKEVDFKKGSEISLTWMPRQQMYEIAMVLDSLGTWDGSEKSEWLKHLDEIKKNLLIIKEMGVTNVRLAILPFEITKDGEEYDWEPIETALDMLNAQGISADLCLGIDLPYYPGIRLPSDLQTQLEKEYADTGQNNISISMGTDDKMPKSSVAIRDFSLKFLKATLEKYAKDERIRGFYLANEWPSDDEVEGLPQGKTLSIKPDFMLEFAKVTTSLTDKPLSLNTNIHVSNPEEIKKKLGPLLDLLTQSRSLEEHVDGKREVKLGLDIYPQKEEENWTLKILMDNYKAMIARIQADFPGVEIVTTEFQAEPWPPDKYTGDSWAKIYAQVPDIITQYYLEQFPTTLDSHAKHFQEVGLWGAAIPILSRLGYNFPAKLMRAVADAMAKA